MTTKATLSIIEDVVTYRDQVSDRATRDMLADAANELSRLNARSAELQGALAGLLTFFSPPGEDSMERFERIAAEFYDETRMVAPGKSEPLDYHHEGRDEERRERYDRWVADRVEKARSLCPERMPREPVKASFA